MNKTISEILKAGAMHFCSRGLVFFCSNALERMQRGIDRDPEWRDRRRWSQIIAGGMAYLHCLKIMHNDLKSNRILLAFGPYRIAKITDFGLW